MRKSKPGFLYGERRRIVDAVTKHEPTPEQYARAQYFILTLKKERSLTARQKADLRRMALTGSLDSAWQTYWKMLDTKERYYGGKNDVDKGII